MKQLIKILLSIILSALLIFCGGSVYLKYSARKIVTEEKLNLLFKEINSTPSIPQKFKDTYSKVYPNVFKNNFNSVLIKSIFGTAHKQSPSQVVANEYWWLIPNSKSEIVRKLEYLGFVWTIEDSVTQEKCFEYYLAHFDFTFNAIGINQASIKFYNKNIDLLSIDEQLGLILLIKNPAYFNRIRFPERSENGIKKLKEIIKAQTQ